MRPISDYDEYKCGSDESWLAMIMINLTPDDLVGMRFAYRPLLEIPLSFRVLSNPSFQAPYLRWLNEARRSLNDAEFPYLSALATPSGYIPDFLTPAPLTNRVNIEDDFEDILATPDAVIRGDIQMLIAEHGDSEMRQFFLIHPREAVFCLVEELRLYWNRVLAHYWSRMISTLEGDMLHRGRLLALNGAGALFEDLHPTISYRPNQINIQPVCQCLHHDVDFTLTGDGIQLVPMIFQGCGRMFQVTPGRRSMLAYGVRGTGLWPQKQVMQSLELALGTGRARVLQALRTPATTGEVAYKLHVSAGTASQHLARLTKAGLVEPRRSGKRVFYTLTQRGEHLIALFERPD
jgi:DNA-binding MarR family transcriptional regulator